MIRFAQNKHYYYYYYDYYKYYYGYYYYYYYRTRSRRIASLSTRNPPILSIVLEAAIPKRRFGDETSLYVMNISSDMQQLSHEIG